MLEIIVLTIFIATIINLMLTRFSVPTIIGYIATGAIIATIFNLHHENNSQELHTLAEFGIVFLMFTIGLEFSIQHLIKMKKEVFLFGSLQVAFSMLVFFLLSHFLFDIAIKASIIIAAALALSSTAIVLKLLNSNRDISKEYGRYSLGILIFQDIMVIPILLMITIFSADNLSLSTLLLRTTLDAIVLFIVLWAFGKFILEPFLNEVIKSNSDEIFIGSILFLVMGASLLAHSLGFSYSLGAFIAGMIISETHYKHQVEADLIPFRDLLLGIFFITVGMQINFDIIALHYLSIIGLLFLFAVVKIAIIFLLIYRVSTKRTAIKTALALFQLGEFGLVVFELANAKNLLDPSVSQILIVTIILSMLLTPFVLKNIAWLTDKILQIKDISDTSMATDTLNNHVVVLGYGRLGRKICEKLEKQKIQYIAIESNIHNVIEAQKDGKNVMFGNAGKKNILESVGISKSIAVIVSLDNSEKLHLVCEILKTMHADKKVIIKVDRFKEEEELKKEFPLYRIVVGTEQVARGMIDSMLERLSTTS